MSSDPGEPAEPAAVKQLDRAVLEYTSAHFKLGDDLRHLDRVQQVGAPEGTIFYRARILEVLAADALKVAGLPASAVVLSNLILLEQFSLIPTTTRYWAHALRRLGNAVRHLHRRVTPNDANVALEFTERLLQWFFCRFDDGRRLSRITADGGPVWHDTNPGLHALMEAFDAPRFDPLVVAERIEATEVLMMTPALPAVLAEILLDHDECVAAEAVLCRALTLFPTDVRLQQLMGLYHSRTGNLDAGLSFLEPLYESLSDDEETAGILGGIYKRAWRQERSKGDWLAQSHRAYRRGWERSKATNAYTGINAATTALWLGRPAEAQEIAEKVRALAPPGRGALRKVRSHVQLLGPGQPRRSGVGGGERGRRSQALPRGLRRVRLASGRHQGEQRSVGRDPVLPGPVDKPRRLPGRSVTCRVRPVPPDVTRKAGRPFNACRRTGAAS